MSMNALPFLTRRPNFLPFSATPRLLDDVHITSFGVARSSISSHYRAKSYMISTALAIRFSDHNDYYADEMMFKAISTMSKTKMGTSNNMHDSSSTPSSSGDTDVPERTTNLSSGLWPLPFNWSSVPSTSIYSLTLAASSTGISRPGEPSQSPRERTVKSSHVYGALARAKRIDRFTSTAVGSIAPSLTVPSSCQINMKKTTQRTVAFVQ